MKRILLLGGNGMQVEAIKAAKRLGYYVITCDYLPENPGHAFSDEYHNVSTTDQEAVLELARELKIDGIASYASDVSQPTVAYVAKSLGLPGNPYESVITLTHKDRFRKFLQENGFASPRSGAFATEMEAEPFARSLAMPFIVKPADASGSKGLTKICEWNQFVDAFAWAHQNSLGGTVIVEDFIEHHGYQQETEGFYLDGKIVFYAPMDQHQDLTVAPYSPMGSSVPSLTPEIHEKAAAMLERIFRMLDMKFCSFNFEFLVGSDGEVYPLEVGPRNGGNMIPDAVECAYGVSLAEYAVKAALGEDCSDLHQVPVRQCATCYLIHALEDGTFDGLQIDESVEHRIVKRELFCSMGEKVRRFHDARDGLGCLVLAYGNDLDQMKHDMDHMNSLIRVKVRKEA